MLGAQGETVVEVEVRQMKRDGLLLLLLVAVGGVIVVMRHHAHDHCHARILATGQGLLLPPHRLQE
jgi:hypothetical protein